ncbi:hypothetical protein GCM10022270_12550 [Terriglobus aquaticus]
MLPVLAVRLLDFATYWIFGSLKGPAMKAVAPKSVLGGFSGKVSGPVVVVAAVFTFLPLLIEIGLLVYGMAVTGRWAHRLRDEDGARPNDWTAPMGEVLRVAAFTLGVGALTAVVGLFFSLRGGVPPQWGYVVTWCFLILSVWFILPAWLRLLAGVQGVRLRETSRIPAFVVAAISFALFAAIVYAGGALQRHLELAHRIHGAAAPFAINLMAACVSAIPLASCFVALSRSVAERPGWQPE